MQYRGSCHCGKTHYTVEGELSAVNECNCSICRRKGTLLWFVPRSALHLETPESHLATYTFNQHVIQHRFCPDCGCSLFEFAQAPDGSPTAAINVRCLEGVDIDSLPRHHVNGIAF